MKWTDEMIDGLVDYLNALEDEGYTPSEITEMRHEYVAEAEAEFEMWN